MIRLNIHEAKTHLSRYLNKLTKGKTIILCRHNEPIAEIRALPGLQDKPRRLGGAKGVMKIPASFFEPLPKDFLEAFTGPDR
ncbi:MAG: type II toxin-antitoxin system Phd/YefM family antitoxin [Nitrospira sp.]|nr:MAG: type II toxin-antitoxin system Phd/YefM family antitoxin [Nitrospira sp.]